MQSNPYRFIDIAGHLDSAGLVWQPEIGDEVSYRIRPESISILVDPEGMTPKELRSTYLWLPSVEQMVFQLEARQAILFHAGLELSDTTYCYKTVIQSQLGAIEAKADSLRAALGLGLRDLLLSAVSDRNIH